jgi:hypothetical protein
MGLFTESGTRLSKTAAQAKTTATPAAAAQVTLTEPIYEDFDYGVVGASPVAGVGLRLRYRAGQSITQGELDSLFVAATQTAVAPTGGAAAGGTPVTVTGTNFTGGSTVTVGGVAATVVKVVSPTSITCTTPAGTAGAKAVVVTTSEGVATGTVNFTFA